MQLLFDNRLTSSIQRLGSIFSKIAGYFAMLVFGALGVTSVASQAEIPLPGESYQTASESTFDQTSTQWNSWYCACYTEEFNLRTNVSDSEEFGAPISVRIDSIAVRGDLARDDEYVQMRIHGSSDYLTYQGGAFSSAYTTYAYSGPQPALSRSGEKSTFGVDINVPSTVNSSPEGMYNGGYWQLGFNMTVTYEVSPALTPTFSNPASTEKGFTVEVTNYDEAFSWSVTTTAGAVAINSSGVITVSGLTPQQRASLSVTTARQGYYDGIANITGAAATGAGLVPEFYSAAALRDGFTIQVSNYDSAFDWTASSSKGFASISNTGLVTVSGIGAGESALVTVRTSREGYFDGSATATGSASARPGLTPIFASAIPNLDGFQVDVINYDAAYTWLVVSSEGGASISSTGRITVFGTGPGRAVTATVTTSRTGYDDGEAQIRSASLARQGLTPDLGSPEPTADGFTVPVTNYSSLYRWTVSTTAGQAGINSAGLITVGGLRPGQIAKIEVTTQRDGHTTESAEVTSSGAGVTPLEIGGQTKISNLAQGDRVEFIVSVTPEAQARYSAILIRTRAGAGDADLFVGEGFRPEPYQDYSCGSENRGNAESCEMVNPRGSYYITVYGYRNASNIVISAEGVGPPDAPRLTQAVPANLAAKISFETPANNGAAIENYSARCVVTNVLSDRATQSVVREASDQGRGWRVQRMIDTQRFSGLMAPEDAVLLRGPSIDVYGDIPDRIDMDLIDDRVMLTITAARKTPADNIYVTGKSEDGGDFSLLVTSDGAMVGRIYWGDDLFLISPSTARGVSVLRSVLEAELKPMQLEDDFRLSLGDSGDDVPPHLAADDGDTVIDLLVLYEPQLGKGAADYALQYTNDIHARSGTGVTFIASAFRAYQPRGNPLEDIASSTQVRAWRDTDRADLVAWIGKYSRNYGYCGVAYAPGVNGSSFNNNVKRLGFSVSLVGTDDGYYCTDEVLAHELGHNLGNLHDRANSGNSRPYRPYGYGDGIRGVFGTVQSYLSPEQGKFSSPKLLCAGRPCGRAGYTDVVQAIRDVKSVVAEIYPGSGTGGGQGRFTVTPSAGFGGTVSPSGPRTLSDGSSSSFTFYPDTNYRLYEVSGNCQGRLDGNTYTVKVSGSDCSLTGTFEPSGKYYTVSIVFSDGGSVKPSGKVKVTPGDELPILIEPAAGFSIAEIWGSCGGVFDGRGFTTDEVLDDCSVFVRFARTSGVATGKSSPLLVTGLSERANYQCSVTATNKYGVSDLSNSALVIPGVLAPPNPPEIITVDSENGSLVVNFTENNIGIADVTYTAICGGVSFSSDASPIRVNGLKNDVAVSCMVVASNEKGSANSAVVVATPEELIQGFPVWLLYEATSRRAANR
ncbi:M12 family metallo-peptidase [Luminiphilus sp.]|nr:M12 family metallo-peptidase [Luminiphilus sp.]